MTNSFCSLSLSLGGNKVRCAADTNQIKQNIHEYLLLIGFSVIFTGIRADHVTFDEVSHFTDNANATNLEKIQNYLKNVQSQSIVIANRGSCSLSK